MRTGVVALGAALLGLFLGATPALCAGAAPEPATSEAPIDLAAWKGKVVYVDFWASWCGPCRQSFPWMNEMQAKYGAQGLQVVGINLDAKRADADQFLAQLPAKFAVAFDPKADSARRFGVKGMPTSVLVDPQGCEIATIAGPAEWASDDAIKLISAALKPVAASH